MTEGKVLYMAVPRLADELPFYLLDPEHLSIDPWEAAAKEGAAKAGRKVAATELPSVDLVVCGSVSVNRGALASARAEDSQTLRLPSWSRLV